MEEFGGLVVNYVSIGQLVYELQRNCSKKFVINFIIKAPFFDSRFYHNYICFGLMI